MFLQTPPIITEARAGTKRIASPARRGCGDLGDWMAGFVLLLKSRQAVNLKQLLFVDSAKTQPSAKGGGKLKLC
jgi:hypothetical protein